MKKGFLIGGGIAAVLIIAIVLAVYFLFSSLDSLVKTAVETYGSKATNTRVTLREVKISPTTGQGALRGLVVGNPSGFHTPNALSLGEIAITLDIESVTREAVLIRDVIIDAPEVTYELSDKGSNIDALKRNVQSNLKTSGGNSSAPSPKVIVENLYVRNGTVNVSASILQGKSLSASLPNIHLRDIGKDTGGARPEEMIEQVFGSISTGASKAVAGLNVEGLAGKVGDKVKAVTDSVKQAGKPGIADALKGGAEGAGKTIKGLFK